MKDYAGRYPLTSEVIHNWSQCWANRGIALDLPTNVRAAIMRAHLRHHNDGADARECAEALSAEWPDQLCMV